MVFIFFLVALSLALSLHLNVYLIKIVKALKAGVPLDRDSSSND